MQYQDKLTLERLIDKHSPMVIVEMTALYLKDKASKSLSFDEVFCLNKVSNILNKCGDLVNKAFENMREYSPKHRIYDSIHYSNRHARETFKR